MWKVATWNVNSVKARQERLLAFLSRHSPDVVLLQEIKCEASKFPLEAIESAGYAVAVYGQKAYNGVAILSRSPLQDVQQGFGDGGPEDARLISATVQGVRVLCAYAPNGQAVGTDKYQYKLQWFQRLRQHLDKQYQHEQTPLLIGGDFNVAPEDRDVHDPEKWSGQILFSQAEKQALATLCGFGLYDTFRKHHLEAGLYSWWDYRMLSFPKNYGLRIDFLLASPPLYETCVSASIDRQERKGAVPSDHAPVLAEFRLPWAQSK